MGPDAASAAPAAGERGCRLHEQPWGPSWWSSIARQWGRLWSATGKPKSPSPGCPVLVSRCQPWVRCEPPPCLPPCLAQPSPPCIPGAPNAAGCLMAASSRPVPRRGRARGPRTPCCPPLQVAALGAPPPALRLGHWRHWVPGRTGQPEAGTHKGLSRGNTNTNTNRAARRAPHPDQQPPTHRWGQALVERARQHGGRAGRGLHGVAKPLRQLRKGVSRAREGVATTCETGVACGGTQAQHTAECTPTPARRPPQRTPFLTPPPPPSPPRQTGTPICTGWTWGRCHTSPRPPAC